MHAVTQPNPTTYEQTLYENFKFAKTSYERKSFSELFGFIATAPLCIIIFCEFEKLVFDLYSQKKY